MRTTVFTGICLALAMAVAPAAAQMSAVASQAAPPIQAVSPGNGNWNFGTCTIYQNTTNGLPNWSPWHNAFGPAEYGDHANLIGVDRAVTELELLLYSNVAGTTDLVVRLYNGRPDVNEELLWTGTIPGYTVAVGVQDPVIISVPGVVIPGNDCTVTMDCENYNPMPAMNTGLGFLVYDPPTAGTSEDNFPGRTSPGGAWGNLWFGGTPVANLGLRISTCEVGCGFDPCDANCDGTVDAFDIEPFIGILTGTIPTPCSECAGDANGDMVVDAFDIEPFIACLTGP